MRMRRKRNLDERLLSAKSALLDISTEELNAQVARKEKDLINLHKVFGNNSPLYLEIGCGKGGFAIELAKQNPNINVVAVEMLSNYIVDGCDRAIEEKIPNLKFLCTRAEYLPKYFLENSVAKIFLNFSTPFPKTTYANSRLTNERFLQIYRELLLGNGEIHQKTDNEALFNYSLAEYEKCGFEVLYLTTDLHKNPDPKNILTEYERKFVSLNFPIYKVIVKK